MLSVSSSPAPFTSNECRCQNRRSKTDPLQNSRPVSNSRGASEAETDVKALEGMKELDASEGSESGSKTGLSRWKMCRSHPTRVLDLTLGRRLDGDQVPESLGVLSLSSQCTSPPACSGNPTYPCPGSYSPEIVITLHSGTMDLMISANDRTLRFSELEYQGVFRPWLQCGHSARPK